MLAGLGLSQIGAKWTVLHSYVAGCLLMLRRHFLRFKNKPC